MVAWAVLESCIGRKRGSARGEEAPFPTAVGCVHISALKIAPKTEYFFSLLTQSSSTCSAAHPGGCHVRPQAPPALRVARLESGLQP